MNPLRIFRRRRDLVCRQVITLLTDYIDDALPPPTRERLEAHLAVCPHCTEYLAQLRATIRAAQLIDVDAIDEATKNDLVDLYRRWRAESQA